MGQLIFAAPIAGLLAGLLGAGVVVLLYMLKLRRRPVSVSSTMLWMSAVRDMEGNIPWQAARPTLLMLMHLLIVALIALAIANPSIGGGAVDQRVVLVIDTSASMNAMIDADGTTRLDVAKKRAAELVRTWSRGSGSPELILYRAGQEPRLVVSPTRDSKRAMREIAAILPTDEPGQLAGVFEQIQNMLSTAAPIDEEAELIGKTRVIVLSDGGATGIPASIAGAPVEVVFADDTSVFNVGITAVSAHRDRTTPDTCRVFVRVQSTEIEPVGIIVRVLDGQQELARTPIALGPATDGVTVATTTIRVHVDHHANLQVVFDRSDALDADNIAWVWVPDPSRVRVVVQSDGTAHPILLDVLEAITTMSPTVIGVNDPIPAWAQLVIGDGVLVTDSGNMPSISFGPAGDVDSKQPQSIVSWKRAHPLLSDVSMGGVAFVSARVLDDESESSVTVLASGKTDPVMIERVGNGSRHLEISFDLDDSNWAIQVGFAIFLSQGIEYLVPGASGVGIITTTSTAHSIVGEDEIQTPQGVRTIGVSLLNARESDLSNGSTSTSTPSTSVKRSKVSIDIQRPIGRWFVLAALVVMLLEWFLHAARLRV